jgi:hypothetical protein
MDGHVHIATRVHWEQINRWNPQVGWWNYAQAHAAGVNCAIDGLGTYGYWNYNQAPKHTLRLIETFHRIAEANTDKMDIALTATSMFCGRCTVSDCATSSSHRRRDSMPSRMWECSRRIGTD